MTGLMVREEGGPFLHEDGLEIGTLTHTLRVVLVC